MRVREGDGETSGATYFNLDVYTDLASKLEQIETSKRTLEQTRLQKYNTKVSDVPLTTPARRMDSLPSSDVYCEGDKRTNRFDKLLKSSSILLNHRICPLSLIF